MVPADPFVLWSSPGRHGSVATYHASAVPCGILAGRRGKRAGPAGGLTVNPAARAGIARQNLPQARKTGGAAGVGSTRY
jgi:hypothetical protein